VAKKEKNKEETSILFFGKPYKWRNSRFSGRYNQVAIENQRKNHKPKENSYKKTENLIFLLTNCQSNGLQNSDKAGNARASGGRHHAAPAAATHFWGGSPAHR